MVERILEVGGTLPSSSITIEFIFLDTEDVVVIPSVGSSNHIIEQSYILIPTLVVIAVEYGVILQHPKDSESAFIGGRRIDPVIDDDVNNRWGF